MKLQRVVGLCLAATVMLCGWAGVAKAELYKGTVTAKVQIVDPSLASFISIDDPIFYEFIYESTTAASGDSVNAVFDGLLSVSFSIGAFSYSSISASEIQVDNDPAFPDSDRFFVLSRASQGLSGPVLGGLTIDSAGPVFFDSTNTAVVDATVLPTSFDLSAWDFAFFGATFTDGDLSFPFVSGEVLSVTLQIVPEPSTLGLLAVGAAMLGRRRR